MTIRMDGGTLERIGDIALTGALRVDGDLAVYQAEGDAGRLVVDLGERAGLFARLPKPTKKGAIQSQAFVQLWELVAGDNPLLNAAVPTRYSLIEDHGRRFLIVETNGLPEDAEAEDEDTSDAATDASDAPEEAAADAPATEEAAAEAPQAEEAPADAPQAEEAAPEAEEAAPEAAAAAEPAEAPAAPLAPEAEPMAAAPAAAIPPGELPGMELAALPPGPALPAVDAAAVREQVATLLREGDKRGALGYVQGLLGVPDTARRLAENLFLYSLYGRLTAEQGQDAASREALQRAFELDPRDREVLSRYGALLESSEGSLDLLFQVSRNLLLHHRRELSPEDTAAVYRRLGRYRAERGELERARVLFERALDANPADRDALDLLLKTVEAEGDPERVIKVRQRLLEQMRDPAGRAMLRVAIGDDYLSRLHDVHRAMEAWEASIAEHPSAAALTRLARLAIEREDWERAVTTYVRMGTTLEATRDRAEAWLQAGKIYRHHMWNLDKAAEAFEKTLDLQPERLESFQELTSLLIEGEAWERLRGAYERMIQRLTQGETRDKDLLGALHRNLGHLLQTHLDDKAGAEAAYRAALDLHPGNVELLERLAELFASYGEDQPEKLALALRTHQQLADLQPEKTELLERLGILYLRLKRFDPALCIFRALAYSGAIDDRARAFVDGHASNVLRPLSRDLDEAFYRAHLLASDHDHVLSEILAIAREALALLLAHDLEHYDLRPKHRIDKRQGVMFNAIYHPIAARLGFAEAPEVYERAGMQGMINGSLYPPGFLVGSELLSGYSEKEAAFLVAKQLSLFRAPSFLMQLRPVRDLQVIFFTMVKLFRPDANIPLNKDMEAVAKAFKKLKADRFDRLQELMLGLMQSVAKMRRPCHAAGGA
jgi:tetratricopeptide (TPR) repeat protein